MFVELVKKKIILGKYIIQEINRMIWFGLINIIAKLKILNRYVTIICVTSFEIIFLTKCIFYFVKKNSYIKHLWHRINNTHYYE